MGQLGGLNQTAQLSIYHVPATHGAPTSALVDRTSGTMITFYVPKTTRHVTFGT
jgi:hypothetical protein